MKHYWLILLLLTALTNCTKTQERSIQSSKDYALMQTNISYVAPLVIHTIQTQGYLLHVLNDSIDTLNTCASFLYVSGDTVDIAIDPVRFEMLFSHCSDFDGAQKNGSLNVRVDNYFDTDSATASIQFDNFSINGNIMNGDFYVKRIGSNNYRITSSNVSIIVGTREIQYAGTLQMNMGTGGSVDLLYDNILTANDKGTLVDRYGESMNFAGTEFKRSLSCNWYTFGLAELENADGDSQILDFGDGSCDNIGTITFAEEEVNFQLGE